MARPALHANMLGRYCSQVFRPQTRLQTPIDLASGPSISARSNLPSHRQLHYTSSQGQTIPSTLPSTAPSAESGAVDAESTPTRKKRPYSQQYKMLGKSMTARLAIARSEGRIARWQEVEQDLLNRGEPSLPRKQVFTVENLDKAVKNPIPSILLFRYRGEKNPQWELQIWKTPDRGFEGYTGMKGKIDTNIAHTWSKSAPPISSPPSEYPVVGVFARSLISYEGMENRGLEVNQASRAVPEWMAWCVVEVGKRIKDLAAKGTGDVVMDLNGMLNDVYSSEARSTEVKTTGRPRLGRLEAKDGFRIRWRLPSQRSLLFRQGDDDRASKVRAVSAGLWLPLSWSKVDAYRAVEALQMKWLESKDLSRSLDEWAQEVDRDLGY